MDISKNFNYKNWNDLKAFLENFNFPIKNLKIYPEDLKHQLVTLSSSMSPNKFRDAHSKILSPITRKDLKGFHDQLASTIKQMTNAKSIVTFEEIMRKIQEIISDELEIVEKHRDTILYELTALEILLQPLSNVVEGCANALEKSRSFLEIENVLVERVSCINIFVNHWGFQWIFIEYQKLYITFGKVFT